MRPVQARAISPARISSILNHTTLWSRLTYILGVLYVCLVLATFKDYGITYDEYWQATYGGYVVKWYASGFTNHGALTYGNLMEYGGFFSSVYWLVGKLRPFGEFETRHLLIALTSLVGMIYTYRIGQTLGGPRVAFLATLFLVLTPRFYGHSFNNPIDLPVASISCMALYYLIMLLKRLPKPPVESVVKLGLATGLALGIRVGMILLIGYIALALLVWYVLHIRESSTSRKDGIEVLKPLSAVFLSTCILAYAVMLVWWPAAQVAPITYPLRTLRNTTHFEFAFPVYFDGAVILNTQLPWYYHIKWLLITLPEFLLLSLAIAVFLGSVWLYRFSSRRAGADELKIVGVSLVALSSVVPIGLAIVTRPTDYDEIRHFLFIIPGLCVLAALSLVTLLRGSTNKVVKALVVGFILVDMGVTAIDMVRLHPDQYVYFNRLFGHGVADASKAFETDYWGNSYKEAVDWVLANVPSPVNGSRVKVASCLYSLSTSYYLPNDKFEYVGSYNDGQPMSAQPDLFLASTRWQCDKNLSGTIVHIVSRMGAPLSYVVKISNQP
jgi:4-amino-4-deoxy-L-arabinose transferase-like glycosyltransferase